MHRQMSRVKIPHSSSLQKSEAPVVLNFGRFISWKELGTSLQKETPYQWLPWYSSVSFNQLKWQD